MCSGIRIYNFLQFAEDPHENFVSNDPRQNGHDMIGTQDHDGSLGDVELRNLGGASANLSRWYYSHKSELNDGRSQGVINLSFSCWFAC